MTLYIVYGIAAIIIAMACWSFIKKYKAAKEDDKPKMRTIALIVVIISIGLFASIKALNLPELLFPGYGNIEAHPEVFDEEIQK